MSRVSLKNLIIKDKVTHEIVKGLILQSGNALWVEDSGGTVLAGHSDPGTHSTFPIVLDDESLGSVKGSGDGTILSGLINHLVQKEAAQKKLGSEVLNLYQELNVIYNFSEQLTQTIEPDIIAQITLKQAVHSIPSESGVIVLWDEGSKQLGVPAATGDPFFNIAALKSHTELLFKIGMSGQSEILSDISILKSSGILTDEVHSIIYAAMKVKHRIMGAIILAGVKKEQYSAAHLKLLVTLALQSSTAIESAMLFEKNIREVREREEAILRIHEVTKKFVPIEFIRALGKESLTDIKLGDQVGKIVTVLFTDIRDFTSISEKMTPDENFRFVSAFNERLGPIIRDHRGFINQYLGDSIMALFPEDPEDALKAAIKMQQAIHLFNLERKAVDLPAIKAGIGLHTGPLIMGITGDEFRLDAATISDTVNSASRIESLTKYYRSPLLLSGETLRLIDDHHSYQLRHLGKVQLKGKNNLITIIECINGFPEDELILKMDTLIQFKQAMEYYNDQQFDLAAESFGTILNMDPGDHAAIYFRNSALKFIQSGVPDDFKGAEIMMHK